MPDRRPSIKLSRQQTVVLSAMLLWAGEAAALGLGNLVLHSPLGANLHAEVLLIETPGNASTGNECFRLGRPANADPDVASLAQGHIALERRNGQSRLIITSDQPINEPVLQINLRIGCGTELVRTYTVLIDPVQAQSTVKARPAALPVANKTDAAGTTPHTPAAPSDYPTIWQAVDGESAQSITSALFPRQPKAQRRFLKALQESNPQVDFGPDGAGPLAAGTQLAIPDTRRNRTPAYATDAAAQARVAPEKKSRTRPPPKPSTEGRMADRLVISGDAEEMAGAVELPLRLSTALSTRISSTVSEATRDVLRIEYKLLGTLYEQATQQLAVAEQIRNLEARFEEMRAANERAMHAAETAPSTEPLEKPEPPAASSAARTSVPSTPTAAPRPAESPAAKPGKESGWWLEILIAVLLIGASTAALIRRFGKKSVPEQPVPDESVPASIPADTAETMLWAESDDRSAILKANTSGITPDIVLDAGPTESPEHHVYTKSAPHPEPMIVEEADDSATVMELAEIMISFGRVQGATQALEDYLQHNPDLTLVPWLKLLEIYRANDMQDAFSDCSLRLKSHFNVAPATWEAAGEYLNQALVPMNEKDLSIESLLQKLPTIGTLPHIRDGILQSWDSPEGLTYLKHLLHDTRDGQRNGFPLLIARELLFLLDLLETRLHGKA